MPLCWDWHLQWEKAWRYCSIFPQLWCMSFCWSICCHVSNLMLYYCLHFFRINGCCFWFAGSSCQSYWLPADWYFWGWICKFCHLPESCLSLNLCSDEIKYFRLVCWLKMVTQRMIWGFQLMTICWPRFVLCPFFREWTYIKFPLYIPVRILNYSIWAAF